jgi:ribonuclease J
VDIIDIPGLTSGENDYNAVFISHHHGDHCGLLGRVNKRTRIYMSEATKNVLEITADFVGKPMPTVHKLLIPRIPETIGDITVTPYPVKHSAWGAMMFFVQSGEAKLLYTGDFNDIDEADYEKLTGVDVLLCEGTNISVKRDETEENVKTDAVDIIEKTQGDVFVLCSTTNINRIQAIDAACLACSPPHILVFDPYFHAIMQNVGCEIKSETVQFLPRGITKGYAPRMDKYHTWFGKIPSKEVYIKAEDIAPMENLVFMVRQSMSGFLVRLAGHKVGISPPKGNRNDYLSYRTNVIAKKPLEGSVLIYSIWRGYENTKETAEFLELCRELGMAIQYLHVSGHAYREHLESSVIRLNPKMLVPIHTEKPENYHGIKGMHDRVVMLEKWQVLNCKTGNKVNQQ